MNNMIPYPKRTVVLSQSQFSGALAGIAEKDVLLCGDLIRTLSRDETEREREKCETLVEIARIQSKALIEVERYKTLRSVSDNTAHILCTGIVNDPGRNHYRARGRVGNITSEYTFDVWD